MFKQGRNKIRRLPRKHKRFDIISIYIYISFREERLPDRGVEQPLLSNAVVRNL